MSFLARICLVLWLVPALLTLFWPGLSGSSRIERRELQRFPGWPAGLHAAYHWPREFDQFVADGFPFRSRLIAVAGAGLYRLDSSLSPEISVEEDGWLFLRKNGDVLNKLRGADHLSPAELDTWGSTFQRRQERLAAMHIRMVLAVVPDKQTVYQRYLHPWHRRADYTVTDQIVGELARRGVGDVIDLRPLLIDAARTEKIYDQFNSHWNDRGAFLACQEILRHFPEATPLRDDEVSFHGVTRPGDLSTFLGSESATELTVDADITHTRVVARENDGRAPFYETEPWVARTSLRSGPTVLALCDSFTNTYMYKFLEESFPTVIFKHHNGLKTDAATVRAFRPQVVLYIVAERLLPAKLDDTLP